MTLNLDGAIELQQRIQDEMLDVIREKNNEIEELREKIAAQETNKQRIEKLKMSLGETLEILEADLKLMGEFCTLEDIRAYQGLVNDLFSAVEATKTAAVPNIDVLDQSDGYYLVFSGLSGEVVNDLLHAIQRDTNYRTSCDVYKPGHNFKATIIPTPKNRQPLPTLIRNICIERRYTYNARIV